MTHRDKTDPEDASEILRRYEEKAREKGWTRKQLADALRQEIGPQLAGGPNKGYDECLQDARTILNKVLGLREPEDPRDDPYAEDIKTLHNELYAMSSRTRIQAEAMFRTMLQSGIKAETAIRDIGDLIESVIWDEQE